jgi:hypothetical protein
LEKEAEKLMDTPLESVVLVQGVVKERMKKANVGEAVAKVCSDERSYKTAMLKSCSIARR